MFMLAIYVCAFITEVRDVFSFIRFVTISTACSEVSENCLRLMRRVNYQKTSAVTNKLPSECVIEKLFFYKEDSHSHCFNETVFLCVRGGG